jgi:hypothetical protein
MGYLYANHSNEGSLRSSADPQQPFPCAGHFKFTKHSDGTFAIYSMSKVNLQISIIVNYTHLLVFCL